MTRISRGFLAETRTGLYYVDPVARTSRPALDDCVPQKECEVHHRALEGDLIPIRYGLGGVEPGTPEDRSKYFPHARTIINAGCLVREAKIAAVHYCPACREAARAWAVPSEAGAK